MSEANVHADRPVGRLPCSVPCPKCGAPTGIKCQTKAGYSCATHKARWKAAGVHSPTLADLKADWHDDGARHWFELPANNIAHGREHSERPSGAEG